MTKSLYRKGRQGFPGKPFHLPVAPAKAGVQAERETRLAQGDGTAAWIPAFAGMTVQERPCQIADPDAAQRKRPPGCPGGLFRPMRPEAQCSFAVRSWIAASARRVAWSGPRL